MRLKMTEIVVEVGKPAVLKASRSRMLATVTATIIISSSCKRKPPGFITPLRATSIIPPEKKVPISNPVPATASITLLDATREPMAEFKKLTASLETPVIK
jgi:hypothetical protein